MASTDSDILPPDWSQECSASASTGECLRPNTSKNAKKVSWDDVDSVVDGWDLASNQEEEKARNDRLMSLLINELLRKKGIKIQRDVPSRLKLKTLVDFWQESLAKDHILSKLNSKQEKDGCFLNEKETQLYDFLNGTNSDLLEMDDNSSTKSFGELAHLEIDALVTGICEFLKLELRTQEFKHPKVSPVSDE